MPDQTYTGHPEFFQEVEDMRQELSELQYRQQEGDELTVDEISFLADWRYEIMK